MNIDLTNNHKNTWIQYMACGLGLYTQYELKIEAY